MKLFMDEHADMYKEDAGKPYRPANGTEADYFFHRECEQCIYRECTPHDHSEYGEHYCLTEELSFWTNTDHPLYPIELQYGPDGQPCCRRKTVLPSKK